MLFSFDSADVVFFGHPVFTLNQALVSQMTPTALALAISWLSSSGYFCLFLEQVGVLPVSYLCRKSDSFLIQDSLFQNLLTAELLRAKRARGAPWVSKSTHPRKFGNHVTDRPTFRPHHRHTTVYSHTF